MTTEADWKFIPVKGDNGTSSSKHPAISGWQKQENSMTKEQIENWGGNHGLLLGNPSMTISYDFDGYDLLDKVLNEINDKLDLVLLDEEEEEFLISGLRKLIASTRFESSPRRHQILIGIQTMNVKKRKIHISKFSWGLDAGMMIEILATGQQTVIPESTCSNPPRYLHFKRSWIQLPEELKTFTHEEFFAVNEWLAEKFETQKPIQRATNLDDPIFNANDGTINTILQAIERSGYFRDGHRHEFIRCLTALFIENGLAKTTMETVVKSLADAYGGDINDLMKIVDYYYKVKWSRPDLIAKLEEYMNWVH